VTPSDRSRWNMSVRRGSNTFSVWLLPRSSRIVFSAYLKKEALLCLAKCGYMLTCLAKCGYMLTCSVVTKEALLCLAKCGYMLFPSFRSDAPWGVNCDETLSDQYSTGSNLIDPYFAWIKARCWWTAWLQLWAHGTSKRATDLLQYKLTSCQFFLLSSWEVKA